jgi:hypothetical protein
MQNFCLPESSTNIRTISVIFKKLPKVSNHPRDGNWANLVTQIVTFLLGGPEPAITASKLRSQMERMASTRMSDGETRQGQFPGLPDGLHSFRPKIGILVHFEKSCNVRCWCVLWTFGLFQGHNSWLLFTSAPSGASSGTDCCLRNRALKRALSL